MEVNEMPAVIVAFLAGAKAGVELYNLFNDWPAPSWTVLSEMKMWI